MALPLGKDLVVNSPVQVLLMRDKGLGMHKALGQMVVEMAMAMATATATATATTEAATVGTLVAMVKMAAMAPLEITTSSMPSPIQSCPRRTVPWYWPMEERRSQYHKVVQQRLSHHRRLVLLHLTRLLVAW